MVIQRQAVLSSARRGAMVIQRQTMMAEMEEMGIDPMGELRALGYEFRQGVLRQVNSEKGFEFQDGSHYNSLADAVAQYVPLLLEEEGQLTPLWLPRGSNPGEGCAIFVSDGYECAEKLLLIIQGTGRVRAGIWGCSLCINDSLEHGTMLPYIRKAVASGYGVVVFNPNEHLVDGVPVPGLENFSSHVSYVMDNVVSQCAAKRIDIVAHSHGGRALLDYLARARENTSAGNLVDKLNRLVFTDSYHVQTQLSFLPRRVLTLLSDPERAVNFVPDSAPLGQRVYEWTSQEYAFFEGDRGCLCLSSGVLDHAGTNYAAMAAVFEFLQERNGEPVIKPPGQLQTDRSQTMHRIDAKVLASSMLIKHANLVTDDTPAGCKHNQINRDSSWGKLKHYLQVAWKVKKAGCSNNVVPYSNDQLIMSL